MFQGPRRKGSQDCLEKTVIGMEYELQCWVGALAPVMNWGTRFYTASITRVGQLFDWLGHKGFFYLTEGPECVWSSVLGAHLIGRKKWIIGYIENMWFYVDEMNQSKGQQKVYLRSPTVFSSIKLLLKHYHWYHCLKFHDLDVASWTVVCLCLIQQVQGAGKRYSC